MSYYYIYEVKLKGISQLNILKYDKKCNTRNNLCFATTNTLVDLIFCKHFVAKLQFKLPKGIIKFIYS